MQRVLTTQAVLDYKGSVPQLKLIPSSSAPARDPYGVSGFSLRHGAVIGWDALLQRYNWDWFGTFTFADEIHPEAADKVFRVWMSKLQRTVAGPRWYKNRSRTVRWARGLEWQKRGVLHYHALLYACPSLHEQLDRRVWETAWFDLAGGFCSIYPCDSAAAVRSYVAKYCGKGGEVDVSLDLPVVERGRIARRV